MQAIHAEMNFLAGPLPPNGPYVSPADGGDGTHHHSHITTTMGNNEEEILILPAVSSGNIGQLAVDLLIHTLKAEYVDSLDDQYLYPFVGPQDQAETEAITTKTSNQAITTPVDVYRTANGYTLLQLRSPTLPGFREKFAKETILPFIKTSKFKHVIILGSSNAALRSQHPGQPSIQLYSESLADQLSGLSLNSDTSKVNPPPKELPESGIVLDILQGEPTSLGIISYAYEGDNFGDAQELATKTAEVLNLGDNVEWIRPISWKRAYGKDVPVGVEEGLYS